MVALSRSKPWHTGKDARLNLPFDRMSLPQIIAHFDGRLRPGQKVSQRPTRGDTASVDSGWSPQRALAKPIMVCVMAERGEVSSKGTPLLRTSAITR